MHDEHVCPDCGEPMADGFEDLLPRVQEQVAGCDGGVIAAVLAYLIGAIIAQQDAEERPRVRREISALLTRATQFHERVSREELH